MTAAYTSPAHLGPDHVTAAFHCSSAEQTRWLTKIAIGSDRGDFSRVIVTTPQDSQDVVGFYALAAGAAIATEVPERVSRGGGPHLPIPLFVLARLGVHSGHEGRGLGAALLRDAMTRSLAAADQIGARGFHVRCEGQTAKEFYLHHVPGFIEFPEDPLSLILPMKDLRAAMQIEQLPSGFMGAGVVRG